ncbi:hypothetical protein [Streptomyces sp. MJP52]|uniref:hypothetical protein n=1 Tax=Streptomyces sp. MJP52 TaxID=2940555 RepID=UPI002475F8C0|nr:hypothetical protein [Streptomyces sp. MJP52]MDH6223822.1 hypothetical protein [Streptomyces sp. MJP52]
MTERLAPRPAPERTPGTVAFGDPGDTTSALAWSAPELTADRAWAALARTYAAEAAGRQRDYVKLLVNGELIRDPQCWPTTGADSASPASWLARQEKFGGDDDLFVYARTVQEHDRELFRVIVELLAPHAPRLGLPPGHVEAEVFYGAYRNTPGGIHREGCTNLHLVLAGRKSMHFWQGTDWVPEGTELREDVEPEDEVPEEYLPSLDRRSVLEHGHFLTATAGSGFFWRSGIWHVGETHEPSVALNIASYTRTLDVEAELLVPWQDRLHGEVPAPWLAGYRAHVSFTGSDAALLARLTALGMRPAPPDAPPAVPRSVRRVSTAPVVWSPAGPGRLTVAALGHAADFADGPVPRGWLEAALSNGAAANDVPQECGQLAQWLCAQQILEPMEA